MIDLTLRCPTCGLRADMCYEHGDDWKRRPDDQTVLPLLVRKTEAELQAGVERFTEDGEL